MCIICQCSTALTREQFKSCFTSNSHGVGFAWNQEGENHFVKGFMEEAEAWEVYQNVPVPHIAHFRLASAGGVIPELTHPFIISNESPPVLEWHGTAPLMFHNGTIGDWRVMLVDMARSERQFYPGPYSDTRVVAMIASYIEDGMVEMLSASASPVSSKYIILRSDATVTRIGDFVEHEGNFYSNSSFKSYGYASVRGANAWDWSSTHGTYGYGLEFDPDDSEMPVSQRDCTNCRFFRGYKNEKPQCESKGVMINILKCGDWREKRKRGRPKKKALKEEIKISKKIKAQGKMQGKQTLLEWNSGGTRPKGKEPEKVIVPGKSPMADMIDVPESQDPTTCFSCIHRRGTYCDNFNRTMKDFRACTKWTGENGEKVSAPTTSGFRLFPYGMI